MLLSHVFCIVAPEHGVIEVAVLADKRSVDASVPALPVL